MKFLRLVTIMLWMLLIQATIAGAEVSIGVRLPNLSIGINLPLYPELVPVPGYPVYYAPRMDANYFFYDGMYWVYQDDNWYASSWYNGPWDFVEPDYVPLFILRIPVRYYRQPPVYFRGWRSNEPPRWGRHWGGDWEHRRRGWDKWQRSSVPHRAPLPVYQRQYDRERYPQVEHQHRLRDEHYHYEPRDKRVRQHYQRHVEERTVAPDRRERGREQQIRTPRQEEYRQEPRHPESRQQNPVHIEGGRQPESSQREQQAPRVRNLEQRTHEPGESHEPKRGRGQGQDKDRDKGKDRDKDGEKERGRGREN